MPKKRNACGGAVGKGGVNPAPTADNAAVRVAAEQLELVPIDDLVPYANNAKIHDKRQIAQLRASLREFGFVTPVLIDFDNNIIAGHGRVEAARAEGMTEVPCVLVSNLTEAQRKAYILADNRLSETSAWDTEALKIELEGLEALQFDTGIIGFDAEDVKEIEVSGYTRAAPGQGEPVGVEDADAQDDDYDGSVPESCPHKPGDVFRLGRHILVCGDCAKPEITKNFQRWGVSLLLTDPPYGVALSSNESVDQARQRHRRTDGKIIANDDLQADNLTNFLITAFENAKNLLAPGAGFYIWHADNTRKEFLEAVQAVGWTVREVLVWNKNHFTLGRQDYQWKHEPCLYGWNDGAAHYWAGGRAQSTVLDFDRPIRSEEHPTMKPIQLFDRLIRNSCPKGGIVYDPFGGSGTTLLACEQNGRTCWMVELDSRYVQVIIDRWEKLTGLKAEKIN